MDDQTPPEIYRLFGEIKIHACRYGYGVELSQAPVEGADWDVVLVETPQQARAIRKALKKLAKSDVEKGLKV